MIRIPPAKRVPFVSLVLATVAVMGGLWYTLIRPQEVKLGAQKILVNEAGEQVKTVKHNAELMAKYEKDARIAKKALDSLESKLAAGDVYRWVIRTFSDEQKFPNVELSNFEPPAVNEPTKETRVHYRVASFSIAGVALYHDFGKYLANLENGFPNMKIQKLELESSHPGETGADDAEKLNFRILVNLFVKPATK